MLKFPSLLYEASGCLMIFKINLKKKRKAFIFRIFSSPYFSAPFHIRKLKKLAVMNKPCAFLLILSYFSFVLEVQLIFRFIHGRIHVHRNCSIMGRSIVVISSILLLFLSKLNCSSKVDSISINFALSFHFRTCFINFICLSIPEAGHLILVLPYH